MKRITRFIVLSFVASILLSSTFVSSSGAAVNYFVSTKWVAAHQKSILLIDTRSADAYNAGHIQGAINVPSSNYYFDRIDGDPGVTVHYMVPTPTEFIRLVNRWGIKPTTTVVTYGDADDVDWGLSARLTWTLKVYGHKNAYNMDGGLPYWQYVENRKVTTTATLPKPNTKSYVISDYSDILATKYDVLSVVNGDVTDAVIFDTRTPGEYTGDSPIPDNPQNGHISGAISLNWTDVFADNAQGIKDPSTDQVIKLLKSSTDLLTLFADLGITKDKTVIPYCEGGFRSAQITQLLLSLGYPSVRHYQGSWNEWSRQDPSVYLVHTGLTP